MNRSGEDTSSSKDMSVFCVCCQPPEKITQSPFNEMFGKDAENCLLTRACSYAALKRT